MNIEKIKRRYFDMRTGNQTVAPVLQLSNFLMLSYLTINEIIPIYIFAPIFVVGVLITFTLVGNKFRKHQTPTDLNMSFEKATKAAGITYQVLVTQQKIMDHLKIKYPNGFVDQLDYIKRISEDKA